MSVTDKTGEKSKNFQEYFREVRAKYLTRDSTELSLRTPLENFLKSLNKDYNLMQEPKRTAGLGAPDFKAYKKTLKIGYIETKDLGKNLDEELKSEQLEKYTKSIDNLILTNYTRFMLIRNHESLIDFNLFELGDLENSRFVIHTDKIQQMIDLVETFFDKCSLQNIRSASELSLELSKRTKLLKVLAEKQLEEDIAKSKKNEPTSSVYDFYEGAKELIRDITIDDSADAYAETITYGLFLAKMNDPQTLDRNSAASYVPRSIGVIKRIFMNISGDSVPSNLSWLIDEIVDVLNASKIEEVLSEIDSRGKTDKDPFTFFYEDFLAAYDPEKKKHLGVFYTPRPVVSYIINSIHQILKDDFGKPNGFADDSVTVLDPAVGTGTFLWLVYLRTLGELKSKGLSGVMNSKIENHILRHFYGMEIQITPYIIAHLKLSLILKKWFYNFKDNDRNQVYLANTLEPFETHGLLPFLREISEESRTANELKMRKKILVITGNPPYRGMSANKGQWIQNLLKKGYEFNNNVRDAGYYKIDGKDLDEKNPKWLQDDYVKFIRFAQWKIDSVGEGTIGFITNHNYLDNATFRGMRQSLLNSFNRIYILNLHGNALKKEKAPDGSKDENVFEIKTGVAISVFIKNAKYTDKKIFYADVWGDRELKYNWLDRHTLNNTPWEELKPESPNYFFSPQNTSSSDEYGQYLSITDIFPVFSIGIVTARDSLTIQPTPTEIWNTVQKFSALDAEEARVIYSLGKDARDWKIELAQKDLKNNNGPTKENITQILYRPFDFRYTYYTGNSRGFHCMPRNEVMKNMLKDNMCLITRRQMLPPYGYFFVSNRLVSDGAIRSDNRGGESVFPLYLYSEKDGVVQKETNIPQSILKKLSACIGEIVSPEKLLHYIYGVFFSTAYRTKFADFLKSDYPRVPIVNDSQLFRVVAEIGEELVNLHLMKTTLSSNIAFNVQGSNVVESINYFENKVYINKTQFFEGIPADAWAFTIGAYQVLEKWLKSRKNKQLAGEEIEQFIQIVEIAKRTLLLMRRLDEIPFLDAPVVDAKQLLPD